MGIGEGFLQPGSLARRLGRIDGQGEAALLSLHDGTEQQSAENHGQHEGSEDGAVGHILSVRSVDASVCVLENTRPEEEDQEIGAFPAAADEAECPDFDVFIR